MYINTFKYKPEDVSCVLCTEYVKKLGCTALSCPCLAERMEAGTVGYAEAVAELFPYRPRLTARIMRLAERFPGTMWQDDAHRKRMETLRLLLGCRKERDTPELFAALYLLTSSKELADRTFNCFFRGGIDFRYARRRGISSHDYTLLMAAKSLYCHTAEVTQGDLAEPQIIPDEAFRLLINALLIARFGLDALKITARRGQREYFLYVLRYLGDLIRVLYLVAVNAEGRKPLLGMGGKYGGEVYGAGALCAVKAPYALYRHGIHIHGFGAVAPAGSDGEGYGHAFSAELFGAGSGFRHAADGGIGYDHLYMVAVGVVKGILEELFRSLRHGHYLTLKALTQLHGASAAVDDGTDANDWIAAYVAILCHSKFLLCVVQGSD